jgi:hypothetical protein
LRGAIDLFDAGLSHRDTPHCPKGEKRMNINKIKKGVAPRRGSFFRVRGPLMGRNAKWLLIGCCSFGG